MADGNVSVTNEELIESAQADLTEALERLEEFQVANGKACLKLQAAGCSVWAGALVGLGGTIEFIAESMEDIKGDPLTPKEISTRESTLEALKGFEEENQ